MATSSQVREWWADWLCAWSKFASATMFGVTETVADAAKEAFERLAEELEIHGYSPYSVGTYNCRKTTGADTWSLHAYSLAVDIDPADNPYTTAPFSWDDTKFTPEQIDAVESIATVAGLQVFTWGGRWNSVRDYMHFQINVAPDDLAAGLLPKEPILPCEFTDVTDANVHKANIEKVCDWGVMLGFTDSNGNPNGLFKPYDPVSRAQLASVIVRMVDLGMIQAPPE